VVDFTCVVAKQTSTEEVNRAFQAAARNHMQGILACAEEELVSMDFKGDPHSAIVDLPSTMVVGGKLVKVIAWYDNEWGYACRVADLTARVAKSLPVSARV